MKVPLTFFKIFPLKKSAVGTSPNLNASGIFQSIKAGALETITLTTLSTGFIFNESNGLNWMGIVYSPTTRMRST